MLKASNPVVTPIVPRVIVPDPLRRVKLSVAEPSALMVLPAPPPSKSMTPSLAVFETSVVILIAPSMTTSPSKSTSPFTRAPAPVPAVVISPFKVIVEPSILTSFMVVPLPIPPAPTSTVPVVVRSTVS